VSTRSDGCRPHQPEVGVGGDSSPLGACGIDRQPACRSAVMLIAAEHTKWKRRGRRSARPCRRVTAGVMHPQTREAEIRRGLRGFSRWPKAKNCGLYATGLAPCSAHLEDMTRCLLR